MLWVYGRYNYFYSYSAGIDFSRQNQILSTKVNPRAVRVEGLTGAKASWIQVKNC